MRLVVVDVLVGPRGDRVDLLHAAQQVVVDDRRRRPARRVGPAQPADPRRLAGERPLHRLDLAGRAAGVGVGLPEVPLGVALERVDDAQVDPVGLAQVLGVPCGLGEQVPGVEQHDVGVGDRPADEVHEHGVTEAGRHDQAVAVLLTRPTEDLQGMSVLEHPDQSTKTRVDSSTFPRISR